MLQVLCLKESFNEAYGWALMWYEKDNNYQRALDVILEIREKFHDVGLEYIEKYCTRELKYSAKMVMYFFLQLLEA